LRTADSLKQNAFDGSAETRCSYQ